MGPVMPYPGPYAFPVEGGPHGVGGVEPCCGEETCHPSCHGFGRYGGAGDFPVGDGTAHWRVRVEPIFLNFGLPAEPRELSFDAAGDPVAIRNLDFDNELNVRLSIETRLENDHSLEFVFLGFVHWADALTITDQFGTLQSVFQLLDGSPAVPFDDALEHDIAYTSDLCNFEFNYWMPIFQSSRFQSSFMVGGRFLHIEEDFIYRAVDIIGVNTVTGVAATNTTNDILAGQIGLMCWAPVNDLMSLRFDGKVGSGYNLGEQETDITVVSAGPQNLDYSESADTSKGAFFAELQGLIIGQINCNLACYVGYQVLWVDELVLAPEQFNPVFPTAAGGRPVIINDRGNRSYHGLVTGVEVTW